MLLASRRAMGWFGEWVGLESGEALSVMKSAGI